MLACFTVCRIPLVQDRTPCPASAGNSFTEPPGKPRGIFCMEKKSLKFFLDKKMSSVRIAGHSLGRNASRRVILLLDSGVLSWDNPLDGPCDGEGQHFDVCLISKLLIIL